VPEWIPTRSSAKGRLVLTALDQFAEYSYDDVGVGDLSSAAGVTTGSLYHHFGSKLGLYDVARTDIERRVLDRLHGAVAARAGDAPGEAAHAALLVAFDFLVDQQFARLLAAPHPGRRTDPIESYVASVADQRGVPIGSVLVAAWRAALSAVTDGAGADRARAALASICVKESAAA
jgi:AcrR family transcriptional regulator